MINSHAVGVRYFLCDIGCKNEFRDNNEKSCSWSKKRVSNKNDFKAQWPRNGHADSVGVKASLVGSIIS